MFGLEDKGLVKCHAIDIVCIFFVRDHRRSKSGCPSLQLCPEIDGESLLSDEKSFDELHSLFEAAN